MKQTALKRKPMKRSQPRRDWRRARAKVEHEGRCRVCSVRYINVEAAHVIGREKDKENGYRVLEDRVVPLCIPCHRSYDRGEFDLLPALTLAEQVQAVIDADGISLAMKRTAPLAYRKLNQAERECA